MPLHGFSPEGMRSNPHFNPAAMNDLVIPLTEDEITSFLDELDNNKDGHISYAELERKLDAVNQEIAPHPQPHHLHHESREDKQRHAFLRSMYGSQADRISREEFMARVREWKVPSMSQEEAEEESQKEYMRRLGWARRFRSYWAVHGPTIVFMGFVAIAILSFGVWQCVKYTTQIEYRNALGWGVVMAKTSAGLLYMTFFFLLLSMSRYFSTLLRRSYSISRFINWDLSQTFHIYVACLALALATTHAIGHLVGDFIWAGNEYQPQALEELFGPNYPLRSYRDYVATLPGSTGITALGLFYILALTSLPQVRKWSYEVFQIGHLLMFPIIGLMMAHGTLHLLQWPMFGYFLAFPTLLIVIERSIRVAAGFHKIPATIEILDAETIEINVTIPQRRIWKYHAGQYAFLSCQKLSYFAFHPFTISVCDGKEVQFHIKTDGNWTGKLRKLAKEGMRKTPLEVGIDGPFGAPAQRFYDFSHTILVGAGIGVTPFSGILADLQNRENKLHGGPTEEEVIGTAGRSSGGEEVLHEHEHDREKAGRHDSTGSGESDETIREDQRKMNEKTVEQLGMVNGGKDGNATANVDAFGRGEKELPELPQKGRKYRKSSKKQDKEKNSDPVSPADSNSSGEGGEISPHTPPTLSRSSSSTSISSLARSLSRSMTRTRSRSRARNLAPPHFPSDYRRTDFHWIVRDKNYLSWFSDLLNSISRSQIWHRQHPEHTGAYPHLDIRMWTHVTQKRKSISTHIYRWLLELHRTPDHPESPLTGLINPTHYGRPDFVRILDDHYADMMRYRAETGWDQDNDGKNDRFRVGVFFCGTPVVGEVLADRCRLMTARGRADGSNIEYYFMIEVFG